MDILTEIADMDKFNSIGFMQGRLSPIINGRIQRFPVNNWQQEIGIASKYKFTKMEWTVDSETLDENPLLTNEGQKLISEVCKLNNLFIPSVTCDYFMENPPWKSDKSKIYEVMQKIFNGMMKIGATLVVIPLVDHSSIKTDKEEKTLREFFLELTAGIRTSNISVCFESDFEPKRLGRFIQEFPKNMFGINYDIGNSACYGFIPHEEFSNYGKRILNIHVKDRKYNGTTVPLCEGDADFETIFKLIKDFDYRGNYILQTARSQNSGHLEALIKYRDMTQKWVNKNA